MIDQYVIDQWFRRTKRQFTGIVKAKAGLPITYVEIGTWGGAASEWVCQNVLTHPESTAFGIDPYDQSQERKRWDVAAIKAMAATRVKAVLGARYQWIYEPSSTGLLTLREKLDRGIDLLYIDGLHEAVDVFKDFLLAWDMLNPGAIVVFDDYYKKRGYHWPHVKEACAAIELVYAGYIKPISLGRQYAIEIVAKDLPAYNKRANGLCTFYPNLALPHLLKQKVTV